MLRKSFGEYFRELRLNLGLSLKQFCLDNDLDFSNISKIERGVSKPPKDKILVEYAKLLRLKQGSKEYTEFMDLAAAYKST